MRRERRIGFTIVELLITMVILAVLTYAAVDTFLGGSMQITTTTEHLAAMQNALILMEAIQEDLRQISILNKYGMSLVPYSMLFSTNGKSFMMRKSCLLDTSAKETGSSFSVVVYQLTEHKTMPGVYIVSRIERSSNGQKVQDIGRETEETAFRSLLLRDIRFDLVVRMENMTYRTFVRVSISAVNSSGGARDPKLYFISNVFDVPSPEPIHNEPPNPPGFAGKFIMSKFVLASSSGGANRALVAGPGFEKPLPPTAGSWQNDKRFWPEFCDFVDKTGQPKNFDLGSSGGSALNPFLSTSFTAPALRRQLVVSAVSNLTALLSTQYRGRIVGEIKGDARPGKSPAFTPIPFSFDCTDKATSTLASQVNQLTERAMTRGAEAVQEVGHTLGGRVTPVSPCVREVGEAFITTCSAKMIAEGN